MANQIQIPDTDQRIASGTTNPQYTMAHRGPYFAYPERASWIDWSIYRRPDGTCYKVQANNGRWASTFSYGNQEITDDLSRPGHHFLVGAEHNLYRQDQWGKVHVVSFRIPVDGAPSMVEEGSILHDPTPQTTTFDCIEDARKAYRRFLNEGWTVDRPKRNW